MIIEQLTLHDFGIYGGRHEVDLSPGAPDRPVVLIGAINGRGKTTMLDAINLALFGQRARLSNRRPNTAWDRYLRESINRSATGGALVGLRFTVEDDLESRLYEISRSWEVVGKAVKESFAVAVNGEFDRVLAEDWDEHVEGILPLDVASLNFFDGEKIDQIADPVQSRLVLDSAIRGLLGLGILERLEGDLKVLLRRKQDEIIGTEASPEILGLEAEIRSLEIRKQAVSDEKASTRDQYNYQKKLVDELEAKAQGLGADKWEQRAALEAKLHQHTSERSVLEAELLSIAEGAAPLRLVRDLLVRTGAQLAVDREIDTARVFVSELERRDALILDQVEPSVARQLRVVLESDLAVRRGRARDVTVHESIAQVSAMLESAIRETDNILMLQQALENLDSLDARIEQVERQLAMVPSGDQLAPVLESLGRARAKLEIYQQQLDTLLEEYHHLEAFIKRLEQQLDREISSAVERQKGALEDQRIREYADRALRTVAELSDVTIRRNLTHIEDAILNRFHELIGKKNLVTAVSIDRETLELKVTTGESQPLPIERLSAGERQLLATATLWGLSTVSGRSVPLVIDTPLGRLDGEHRINIATNYLPAASHQVIILSTDTEITPDLYELIRHAVGREYLISLSEGEEKSRIVSGFFWESSNAS